MVSKLPFLPAPVEWLHTVRTPVVMDTTEVKTALGWKPRFSSAGALEDLARSRA